MNGFKHLQVLITFDMVVPDGMDSAVLCELVRDVSVANVAEQLSTMNAAVTEPKVDIEEFRK